VRALSELTEKNTQEWLCAVPAFLLAPDLPKEPQINISQTFLKTFPKKSGLEYCHQSKAKGIHDHEQQKNDPGHRRRLQED
jgi:hypothetical protein